MVDGGSGIPRGKGEKATSPTEHQQGSSALGALAAALQLDFLRSGGQGGQPC